MGASKSGPSPTSPKVGPAPTAAAAAAFNSSHVEKRPNLRVVPPRHDPDARKAIREATDGESTPTSEENLLHIVTKPMHFPSSDTLSNESSIRQPTVPQSSSPPPHPHPNNTYRLWFRKKSGGPATSLLVAPHELVDDVKTRILQKYPTSLQQRIDPADLVLTVPQQSGIRLELQPDEVVTKVINEYFNGDMKMSDALEIGASVAFWNGSQWGSSHGSVGGHTPATTPNANGCPSVGLGVNGTGPSSESRGPRSAMQRTRSFGQWVNSPPLPPASSPLNTVGFPFPNTAPNATVPTAVPAHTGPAITSSATTKPGTPLDTSRSPGPCSGNHASGHANHMGNYPSSSSNTSNTYAGSHTANHANNYTGTHAGSHAGIHAGAHAGTQPTSNHTGLALSSGKNSRSNSNSNATSASLDSEPEVSVQLIPRPQPPASKSLNRMPSRTSSSAALAAASAATANSQANGSNHGSNNSSSSSNNIAGLHDELTNGSNGSAVVARGQDASAGAGTHYDFDYDMEYGKWKFSNMQLELSKGTVVPQIKMLIVEDNRINQQILERFLRVKKVQYEVAQTGREALDKWKTGKFHLILMDIQLPVMTGLEATQEIRRLEAVNGIGAFQQSSDTTSAHPQPHPHDVVKKSAGGFRSPVIIVALTASSDSDDLTEALAAGCNDFLTKPVNFAWLERKIIEWGCMQALIDFDGWKTWNVDSDPQD